MVGAYKNEDLPQCAALFMETFNCPPWYNKWTQEAAERYLGELADNKRFAGFVLREENEVIGAAFCYGKTWWDHDELFIDEFFISPRLQRRGYGKILLNAIEAYACENSLLSVTLLTDKRKPAFDFYKMNGFTHIENLSFMYRDLP